MTRRVRSFVITQIRVSRFLRGVTGPGGLFSPNDGLEGKFEVLLQGRYTRVVTGLIKIDTGRVYVEYTWKSKNSYGLAAAIPTPRSNAPLKLSAACPPAGCSLRTWQLPASGLGARGKWSMAMGEVVAFPTVLLVCAHMFLPEREWLVFNLKSFHAATGVKGLEGKFEVLMQDRYRFSVSFLGLDKGRSEREQPISPRHAPRPCTLLPGERPLLLMITPRHHCTFMHTALALSHGLKQLKHLISTTHLRVLHKPLSTQR